MKRLWNALALVLLVNALLMPTAGEVRVAGRATAAWDAIRLRRRTGYVIQEMGLFPHLTVARNVGLVPELEGWPAERIGRWWTEWAFERLREACWITCTSSLRTTHDVASD